MDHGSEFGAYRINKDGSNIEFKGVSKNLELNQYLQR